MQAAETGWTVHGIVQCVWIKDSGLLPRVFCSSREFLLPPLILAELCLGAYHGQPSEAVEVSNVINDPKCNKGPKCNNF